MSTDTNIKTLIFNKLTQEQYDNADRVPTEFYLTPDTSIDSSEKGVHNGVASLDANAKVPVAQIPDLSSTYATINSLATVATSGSYNDLTNKPTIPTVNNATLTIQQNGSNITTFTANSSTNTTANITVPTKLSDLTNDSGFVKNGDVLLDVSAHSTANPRYIWQEKLDDCLYRAETRYTVNLTNFDSSANTELLFDGNSDTYCSILAGNTGVVSISGNTNLGLGYPYGYIYCTFFYGCGPRDISDVTCRVYQNWQGHNIGWVTLTGQEVASSTLGGGIKSIDTLRFYTTNYGINQIEITLNNTNGTSTTEGTDMRLCAINFFATRTSIHSLPVLTKFGGDTIYGNVTIPVQLGSFIGNLTGTADKSVKDGDGNTISSTYIKSSTKGTANGVASLDANAKVPTKQIPTATTSTLGGVKPDGTTITVTEDGTISATGGSGSGDTIGLSIGDVVFSYSSLASENPGKLPLFTGETIASANTIYPEFYNWVSAHTELQCTSAEYEASLTTYGECAKYVIGSGSLRLPLIKNYIKAANPSEGIKNIEAGLPNIEGRVFQCEESYNVANGAFYNGGASSQRTSNSGGSGVYVDFDASRSSAVYGKSDTVTPASTTLYPWVVAYTAAIPASTAQAAEFQQGLSGKADTNLGNIPSNYDYVVEYKNPNADDPNWYRKWKSGKLEQGGIVPTTTENITFLKPFANTNYTVIGNISLTYRRKKEGDNSGSVLFFPEATSFCYVTWAARNFGDIGQQNISWRAEGQGA